MKSNHGSNKNIISQGNPSRVIFRRGIPEFFHGRNHKDCVNVFVACSRLPVSEDDRKKRARDKTPLVSRTPFQSSPLTESPEQTYVFVQDENECQSTWAVHLRKK